MTPADIAMIRAWIARAIGAWTLTHTGLALAVAGWTLLWGQALYGRVFLAQPIVALVFFAGLALGAYDQRRRSRLSRVSPPPALPFISELMRAPDHE